MTTPSETPVGQPSEQRFSDVPLAAPWTPGVPGYARPVAQYGYQPGPGPIGQIRGTGVTILLTFVTFGIYSWFWWYKVHDEMKRHTGEGLGGGLALLITILAGVVMPFVTSSEVGDLYARRGQEKPVTALTGLWYFPGIFILIGPFVWFAQTNGALNAYWRSLGAVE